MEKFKNFDPFFETENEPVLIGTTVVEPKCILHRIPLEENTKIYDYLSKLVGTIHIELVPCDKQGIAFGKIEDVLIQNPEKQLKQLYFLLRINNVKCMSAKYKKIFCQYKLFGDENYSKTEIGGDEANNPNIKYQKLISFDNVDINLIKYYSTYPLFIQVYGVQTSLSNESNKMSTRDWFEAERKEKKSSIEAMKEEMKKLETDLEKYKSKLKNLETLLDFAEQKNKKRIRIDYVRECILSNNPDILAKLYEELKLRKNDSP